MLLEAAFARRGAGGLFVTLGFTPESDNNAAHGLGALIVALYLSVILNSWHLFGWFAGLWILFTKPTPSWNFKTIEETNPIRRAFYYALSSLRLFLILPLALLVYIDAHGFYLTPSFLWFYTLAFLAVPYYAGGRLQASNKISSATEFGEWGYCISGLMLWGLAR